MQPLARPGDKQFLERRGQGPLRGPRTQCGLSPPPGWGVAVNLDWAGPCAGHRAAESTGGVGGRAGADVAA